MKSILFVLTVGLSTTLALEPAWALDSVNLCFQYDTYYEDNGEAGEDYWLSDIERASRGQRVIITDGLSGPTIFDSYLGDAIGGGDPGSGCTGEMLVSSAPGTYYYLFYTYGHVNGSYVRGYDSAGSPHYVFSTYTISSGTGGTYTVTVDTSSYFDEFNVYAAGALALQRHGGGLSGASFEFHVGAAGTGYDSVNDEIDISTASSDEKFKVIHEMGHAMADFTTAGAFVGSNYDIDDATCPEEPNGTLHSMRSEEYQSSSGNEGFAHFYSAVSWNDGDSQNSNCWFEYYKLTNGDSTPAVNCDSDTSNPDFDLAYLETNCGGTGGRGVELDWLRAFWNVHTSGASNRPTFTAIVNWMDDADPPGDTDVYSELDAEANTVGGQLNTNWDSTKVTNGIDH